MKTKTLRLLALLMALTMALSLTACGGDDANSGEGEESVNR